ncbi:hypothetical protein NDU88_002977 [Pleurodeles waltl]|uniref:Uncharacterized protein n=1 Tax=Pleurodeles waltl TaxID=8319 RepID=A0AAV7KUB9_PLEWA|nr:hypothetical protein NDU88_002977 [Pleurodeles waltl]
MSGAASWSDTAPARLESQRAPLLGRPESLSSTSLFHAGPQDHARPRPGAWSQAAQPLAPPTGRPGSPSSSDFQCISEAKCPVPAQHRRPLPKARRSAELRS